MPIATGTALLIAGLAGAGASATSSAMGARSQGQANKAAGEQQLQGIREQIAFERERDAEMRRQWEAEQARRSPYREAADSMLRRQAQQYGLSIAPRQPEQMPTGNPLAGLTGGAQAPNGNMSPLSGLQRRPTAQPLVDPRRNTNTLGALVRY